MFADLFEYIIYFQAKEIVFLYGRWQSIGILFQTV